MDKRTQQNDLVSKDEWYTPQSFQSLLGEFDTDPCAAPKEIRPYQTAKVCYDKSDDGLTKEWQGIVWLNPPYNSKLIRLFVEKLAQHGDGIALLANRVDNLLFQELIFKKATSMIFLRKRIRFINPDGQNKSPMMGYVLVAFGEECDKRLQNCGLQGKYVKLNNYERDF